jgi:hypothetical protein
MKHTRNIILALLLLAATAAGQEFRGVSLEMIVSNGEGREQLVVVGIREGATTGLDPTLEESELPPQPPNEIFDARCISTPGKAQLGLGSLADYRPWPSAPMTETYTIGYQAGINASSVTLSWAETLPGRVTSLRIDGEDVSGQTSVETQFATGQIIVEVGFDPAAVGFTATPNPLSFMVNNKDPLPTKSLTITPTGDETANWVLSTDVDWLTLSPASGEGQQVVEVGVNTRILDAGSYQGTIFVRSPVYNAEADVAVEMEMVVGVEDMFRPTALVLAQNYPNPFNPTTVITLDLGDRYHDGIPSLRVYDMIGREVMDLSSSVQLRDGRQTLTLDASTLSAGTYRYVLRQADRVRVRSMTLIK